MLFRSLLEELHSFRRDQWGVAAWNEGLGAHVISEFGGVPLEALSLGTGAGLGGTGTDDA